VIGSQISQVRVKTDGLNKSTAALKSATERLRKVEAEVEELRRVRAELEERAKTAEEDATGKENMVSINYITVKLHFSLR